MNYSQIKSSLQESTNPTKHPEEWLSRKSLSDNTELVRIAEHPLVDIRQRTAAREQLKRNGIQGVPS